jgi:TonB family protein
MLSIHPLRQARITGDVVLTVEIESNGKVQSVNAVSGHPLLTRAALESAQRSGFDCCKCDGTVKLQLMYTFQLTGADDCCSAAKEPATAGQDQAIPRVLQERNHITVIEKPPCLCDPAMERTKERSWKCFYLWRCATTRLGIYE